MELIQSLFNVKVKVIDSRSFLGRRSQKETSFRRRVEVEVCRIAVEWNDIDW